MKQMQMHMRYCDCIRPKVFAGLVAAPEKTAATMADRRKPFSLAVLRPNRLAIYRPIPIHIDYSSPTSPPSHRFSMRFCLLLALACLLHTTVTARRVVLETSVENDLVMVKITSIHGITRKMTLSLDGRVSTCDIAAKDAAFMDTDGMLLRPMLSFVAAGVPCELDLKFMFHSFRQVTLTHNSIIFSDDTLANGVACLRGTTTRGLCETMSDDITLRWFSDGGLYYENTDTVKVLGVTMPLALWSVRTPRKIVDINEAYLLRHVDIHYDIGLHTVAVTQRHLSRTLKNITALLAAVVAVFFIGRVMIEDTWRKPALHITMLVLAVVTTALSLWTRANGMYSPVFIGIATGVTLSHIITESIRYRLKRHHRREHIMVWIELKPDVALLLTALTLAFYAFASHTLLVLPALGAVFFSVKTFAEIFNLRSLKPLLAHPKLRTGAILVCVCIVTDLIFTVALWRYIVGDFLRMTHVGVWYAQEILLAVITIDMAIYVATLTDKATHRRMKEYLAAHPCPCPP